MSFQEAALKSTAGLILHLFHSQERTKLIEKSQTKMLNAKDVQDHSLFNSFDLFEV